MEQFEKTSVKKPKSKLLKIILLSLLALLALIIIAAFITAVTSSPEEKKARNERIKQLEQREKLEEKAEKEKELKEEEEKNRKNYSKMNALLESQAYIKDQLKSPGSAEFDSSLDGVVQTNDTTFTVKSYVDSQNGYGALLRTHYSCKIIFHPKDDTHNIYDVVVE
jgi:uncharacterized protein YxeA